MENATPAGSQEQENILPSYAVSTDGGEPISSPILPLPGSQLSSKPRKAPTITPRSFTRFFTPKSALERGGKVGASRQVLRDITAGASNRRGRRSPAKDTIQIFEDELSSIGDKRRKKRKIANSLDVTPRSSPLKRIRNQSSAEVSDSDGDTEDTACGDDVESLSQEHQRHRQEPVHVRPISYSGYRSGVGRDLQREIGSYGRITKARSLNRGFGGVKDWQHETTNFYTKSEDVHECDNLTKSTSHSIPFCTASCNSMFVCSSRLLIADMTQSKLACGDR